MKKLTVFIDSSSLKNSSCGLKIHYTVVKGYRSHLSTNVIVWGSAFHKFRALYRAGIAPNTAIIEAVRLFESIPKTIEKPYLHKGFLVQACLEYAEKFPMDKDIIQPIYFDGKPLIEPLSRFAFPYYSSPEVDVIIAGTMDSFEHKKKEFYSEECNVIMDAKTTGTWKVREYMESYRLSPQLLMYRWAVRQYAKFDPTSIWAQLDKTKLGCMIEGIFYSSKAKKDSEEEHAAVKFVRSEPIFFSEADLQEFESTLQNAILKIIGDIKHYVNNGRTPPREGIINDSCNTKYGPCSFFDVCCAPDDEAKESILERDFKVEHYNPLEFK